MLKLSVKGDSIMTNSNNKVTPAGEAKPKRTDAQLAAKAKAQATAATAAVKEHTVDAIAAAKEKADKAIEAIKAKAAQAVIDAKAKEVKMAEAAKAKAAKQIEAAKAREVLAAERAKKREEKAAEKLKNKYVYQPVVNLQGVKYSVAYEVKGNLLLNSKLHNTIESAMWTHKAIKRTGAQVYVVEVKMVALPKAPAAK